MRTALVLIFLLFLSLNANAQRVAFMSSDLVREQFEEAKLAELRLQSQVEEWKRQIETMQIDIENQELKIKQNRLIWTESELIQATAELKQMHTEKAQFANKHFEPGGEYDRIVKLLWEPIETKIFAAVAEVAAEQGFDFVLDKSKQPIPYTNYKYDLTVKILKKLGVDTEELEAQLNEKIKADPRNKEPETKQRESSRRRSRSRRTTEKKTEEFEQIEGGGSLGNPNQNETEQPPPLEEEESEEGGGL